jgi:hypothetical protein
MLTAFIAGQQKLKNSDDGHLGWRRQEVLTELW